MPDRSQKPVIFLAFANDRLDDVGYLRNLPLEMDGIRKALQKARQAGLCEVVERANTTIENILDVFQEYRDRIAIFHYGGHASSYQLLLESAEGKHSLAHSEGLVSFLTRQKGLQMVFLNGCSSQKQALDLMHAGIPAVVGTSQKISDEIATGLSIRFYKGLATGAPLERSWQEAVDQVKVHKGTSNFRDLYSEETEESDDRFPWDIYFHDGAETVKTWSLPEAVGNPLFGLPELPEKYDPPDTPFLFLKRYERHHAAIFFGRSYYVRDLYNRLSDVKAPPIVLLYGQSGVGKSSLFDAGLQPRLEEECTVLSLRRAQDKGLSRQLQEVLAEQVGTADGPTSTGAPEKDAGGVEPQHAKALEQLRSVVGEIQAETVRSEIEALIERLQQDKAEALPGAAPAVKAGAQQQSMASAGALAAAAANWHAVEAQTGKPLIIILDQVEELYTRPNQQEPEELKDLLELLGSIFGRPDQRPKGKLLLGYRKEFHPEIEEAFKSARLPRSTVFLEHLKRKDILDIFYGLTSTPRLKARYGLTFEDDLPGLIADDLLDNRDSPVAPVLQILLTKLWNEAKQLNPSAPRFTRDQYQKLRAEGIAMGEFFDQQIRRLRTWRSDLVDSGLVLDLLQKHTTDMGTAGSRSDLELQENYRHHREVLADLLDRLKEEFLLTDSPNQNEYVSLTHDTLAPVILNEYNQSDRPGQRAVRILNNKMAEFEMTDDEIWLDQADLKIVEQGIAGMRALTPKEERLLEVSRQKREEALKLRRRIWTGGIALVAGVLVSAIFAFVMMNRAQQQANLAQSNLLLIKAQRIVEHDPTQAIRVLGEGYQLAKTPVIEKALFKTYYETSNTKQRFYLSKIPNNESITLVELSSDQKYFVVAGWDSTAGLYSTDDGTLIRRLRHDGPIYTGAFSYDSQKLLTAARDGARLWSVSGDSLRLFSADAEVYGATFSPDGRSIATADAKGCRIWQIETGKLLQTLPHSHRTTSIEYSADGSLILTKMTNGVARLWSSTGDSLQSWQIDGYVISLKISPDGGHALALRRNETPLLWSISGDSLQGEILHSGRIEWAEFSANSKQILTAGFDSTARLWNIDQLAEAMVFRHNDVVIRASFSPDGQSITTASEDSTARVWKSNGELIGIYRHPGEVYRSIFFSDGSKILTTCSDQTARIWPTESQTEITIEHSDRINSGYYSVTGSKVLTASDDGKARLWSKHGKLLASYPHDKDVVTAVFSPDRQHILTGSRDKTARLWSVSGSLLRELVHDSTVYRVAFSPDGESLLTGSLDGTAKIWDNNGDLRSTLKHGGGVYSVAYSPDGRQILTSSEDNTARLWTADGDSILTMTHPMYVLQAIFSPDGNRIVTAAADWRARIFNTDGDSLAGMLHSAAVHSVSYSPDGSKILTASWDYHARLWSADGDLITEFPHDDDWRVMAAIFDPEGRNILTASASGAWLWSQDGALLTKRSHTSAIAGVAFAPNNRHFLSISEDGVAKILRTPTGIARWLTKAPIYELTDADMKSLDLQE